MASSQSLRKQPQRLRETVLVARGAAQGDGAEAPDGGIAGAAADVVAALEKLDNTRRVWDDTLMALLETAAASPRMGGETRDQRDAQRATGPLQQLAGGSAKGTVVALTHQLPSALRQKFDLYRSDPLARAELQQRCRPRKPTPGVVDWVTFNRVHAMQKTPEIEQLQRACEAEHRKVRHKLVAQRRQLHWKQTMDRRTKTDSQDPDGPTSDDLDRGFRCSVWLAAILVQRSFQKWVGQAKWLMDGGLCTRDWLLASRVRLRLMPAVRRYRRRRRRGIRLALWAGCLFLHIYRWHSARRRSVEHITFFLRSLVRELRFSFHMRRLKRSVATGQRIIRGFLLQKAMRIQVTMLQLDQATKRSPGTMSVGNDMRVTLQHFLAALQPFPTSASSVARPKSGGRKRQKPRPLPPCLEALLTAPGVPFLMKLHIAETTLLERRRRLVATWLAEDAARVAAAVAALDAPASAALGKALPALTAIPAPEQPPPATPPAEPPAPVAAATPAAAEAEGGGRSLLVVPGRYFPTFLTLEEADQLLQTARERYWAKVQTFILEIHARARAHTFEAALQTKLEQYHTTSQKREAEWIARCPLYRELMGIKDEPEPPLPRRPSSRGSLHRALSFRSPSDDQNPSGTAEAAAVAAPHSAPAPRNPDEEDGEEQ